MTAVEINIPIFERNLKLYNRKGLRRSYTSVMDRYNEYLEIPPLASTPNVVLEATLDKEYYEGFKKLLEARGYTILGAANTYHMDKFLSDYEKYKSSFSSFQDKIDAVKKERDEIKSDAPYKELENDDVRFYFLPYNDDVQTLYDFIRASRDEILDFAKSNDITIMLKVCPFCTQMDGFFGFNFFDADQKGEVVVDYAARLTVGVNFNQFVTVYQGAVLLSGIGKTKEELADSDLNVHLVAENIRYTKA